MTYDIDTFRCPECGAELDRGEDRIGVHYQCYDPTCGSLFTEDELEGAERA